MVGVECMFGESVVCVSHMRVCTVFVNFTLLNIILLAQCCS